VNIIADKALLAAFAANTHTVTLAHVRQAVDDSEFSRSRPPTVRRGWLPWAGGIACVVMLIGAAAWWHWSANAATVASVRTLPAAPATVPRMKLRRVVWVWFVGMGWSWLNEIRHRKRRSFLEPSQNAGGIATFPFTRREFAICAGQNLSPAMATRTEAHLFMAGFSWISLDRVGSDARTSAAAKHEAEEAEQEEQSPGRLGDDNENAMAVEGAGVPGETAQTQVRQVQVTNDTTRGESGAKIESTGNTTPIEQVEDLAVTVGHRAVFKNVDLAARAQS
jgi:hypothetical protein